MSTRKERAREIREARRANVVSAEELQAKWARERQANIGRQNKSFNRGVRIGLGVIVGVAVAKVINGAAEGGDAWKMAAWMNANGIQP